MTTEKKGGSLRDLADARSGEIFFVDPEKVVIEKGFNVRNFDSPANKEHIEWLAENIKENGQEEPGTVRIEDGHIILVNGESRLRAIRHLVKQGHDIRGFKVQADFAKRSEADRIASLITRNSGKKLEPLETLEVLSRLRKLGWNDTQISKRVGLSQPYISSLLSLGEAPESVKVLVNEGKVSATEATKTFKEHGKAAAEILSEAVTEASQNGKIRATAQHVEAVKAKKKIASAGAPLWATRTVARNLVTTLCEVYVALGKEGMKPTQSYRGWVKDALNDADVNIQEWLKENAPEDEEK